MLHHVETPGCSQLCHYVMLTCVCHNQETNSLGSDTADGGGTALRQLPLKRRISLSRCPNFLTELFASSGSGIARFILETRFQDVDASSMPPFSQPSWVVCSLFQPNVEVDDSPGTVEMRQDIHLLPEEETQTAQREKTFLRPQVNQFHA